MYPYFENTFKNNNHKWISKLTEENRGLWSLGSQTSQGTSKELSEDGRSHGAYLPLGPHSKAPVCTGVGQCVRYKGCSHKIELCTKMPSSELSVGDTFTLSVFRLRDQSGL